MAIKVVFLTTTGIGQSWPVPADFAVLNTVEGIGGGGAGGGSGASGGGGGGAYAASNAIVTTSWIPGTTTISYQVGSGGAPSGNAGTDTWFGSATPTTATGILAKAGAGGSLALAAGGAAASCVGTTTRSGGSGAAQTNTAASGGGGAAGPGGGGGNGGTATAANQGRGGGGGGAGLSAAGSNAGASSTTAGGAGGNGGGGTGGGAGGTSASNPGVAGTAGTGGGGGGGFGNTTGAGPGGAGATGSYWTATAGGTAGSGGGGGGGATGAAAGAAGLYGGGGAGAGAGGAAGAQGIIVITYDDTFPTRYWVGGTGTWDTTFTTNWSLTSALSLASASCSGTTLTTTGSPALVVGMTVWSSTSVSLGTISGGSGNTWTVTVGGTYASQTMTAATVGASAPTSATNVIIDANSGTGTISMFSAVCRDLTVTASQAIILGATNSTLSVFGSMTLPSGGSFSANTNANTITFASILTGRTITTNGKSLVNVIFNGVGGGWTLGSALDCSGSITFTNGTVNTSASNYSITANSMALGTGTKTLTLNGSSVTLSSINFTTNVNNFTFNAGTSTITMISSSTSFAGGALTYNNVVFNNTSATSIDISGGTNTFNNLTFTSLAADGIYPIILGNNIIVNGTLTLGTANTAVRRIFFRGSTIGIVYNVTATTVAALSDVDFRDITMSNPVSGTRLGDCGGNVNITFPASKTVYWNSSSSSWSATAWATSSGGTPALNNFPLAQDTAIFDDAGTATTVNTSSNWNIGIIDMSTRTTAFTFNLNSNTNHYGSITFFSNLTLTGAGTTSFNGRGTQTITSAGKVFQTAIVIDCGIGIVQLGDAFNTSSTITLTRGTLNGNTYNVTCTTFASNNSNTRTLTLGNGLWTLTGTGTVWNTITLTGLTFNKGTSDILLSDTSTTARSFSTGVLTYNKLTIGGTTGTSATTITSASVFSELASTKTVAHTISFGNNPTITTWSVTGTAGNVVTVNSNVAGTQRTVTVTNKTSGIDYLSVQDINSPTTPYTFYVGSNSTNLGNNTGVAFTNSLASTFHYLLTSGTSFTVPNNWNNSDNDIYLIGGGGGGSGNSMATATANRIGGAGGGGGGYLSLTNQTYTQNSTVFYSIGAGGTGSAGAASSGTSTGGFGGTTLWGGTQQTITNLTPTKTQNTAAGTTITINVPTGTVDGDVMVAFLLNASGTGTFTTPAGWRLGATATGRAIFYRTAGNEPASYTFTASISNLLQGYIVTYENAVWGGISTASLLSTPTAAPSVTTTSTNSMVVAFYSTTNSLVTFTTPTNYTALDSDSDSTAGSSALFSRVYAATGATGTATSTPSSGNAIGYQIFLSPNITYSAIVTGGQGGVSAGGTTTTGGLGGAGVTTFPSFVGSTLGTQGNSTTTINVPAGTANGDLMVMVVATADNGNTFNTPAGWVIATPNTGGTRIYYRTAASEPASYTVTTSGADAFQGTISTFRNAAWEQRGAWSAATTNPTAPATNISRGGGFLLWIGGMDNNFTSAFTAPLNYIPMQSTALNNVSFITSYVRNFFSGSSGTVQGVNGSNNALATLISIIPNTTAGNTGGTGGGSTASTTVGACGGGGGGGAAGPNGNGRNGGNGSTGAAVANQAGGGGGGNGGGSNGGNASGNTSGAGGNNSLGSGGGASVTASAGNPGTNGGGGSGGGGGTFIGGNGGSGIEFINSVGSGGGSGGAAGDTNNTATAGLYGGGAGGSGMGTGTTNRTGGTARPGMIFIVYNTGGTDFTDSITENTSLADVLTLLAQFSVNATENVNMEDTEVITGEFTFNITENSNPNDVITISLGFSASVTEDVVMDEEDTIGSAFNFTLSEDVTIQDFNSVLSTFVRSISEGITVDDLNTLVTDFVASITENGVIQDSATNVLDASLSITENSDLATAIVSGIGLSFSRTEPITVEEAEDITAQFAQSVTEPTTIDDIEDITAQFIQSITEPITVDNAEAVITSFLQSITEPITIDDAEIITAQFAQSITEPLTVDDIRAIIGQFVQSRTEPITVDDVRGSQTAFNVPREEPTTIDDTETIRADFSQSVLENVNLADLQTVICAFLQSISEATTLEDLEVVGSAFADDMIENFGIEDFAAGGLDVLFSIVENLNIEDLPNIQASFALSILENLDLLDIAITGGWLIINDDQSLSWNVIDNTSGTTWNTINSDNLSNWNTINNSQ